MSKSSLHSAVGKGRPRIRPFNYHLAPYKISSPARPASSSNGKDQDSEFTISRIPMDSRDQSRTDRRRAASAEVQSLFQRSSDGATPRPPNENSGTHSPSLNTTYLKLDFKSENSQPLGSRSGSPFGNRATAPSTIKERLRQRAAERDRGSRSSLRGFSPNSNSRLRPNRGAQDVTRQNARGQAKAGRPRRGSRTEAPEKGVPFEGLNYVEKDQDLHNMRVYERVLLKYGPVIAGKEELPEGQDIEKDPDVVKYREIMEQRQVKPDLERVLEMPKGVVEERLDSGLHPDTYVERLKAMAEIKSKRHWAWAGLQMGEEQDVEALATQMRLEAHEADEAEVQAAARQSNTVVRRWIGGVYERPHDDAGEIMANAMRGVMNNKSYSAQDSNEFIQQFEKLVGPRDLQPKGKVADAVKAGAREAAMKTDSNRATAS